MATSIGRRLRDGCLTIGSIGTIVGGAAAIDPESRKVLFDALHGQLPSVLTELPLLHIARSITETIPIGTSAMMALVVSAVVLFFLMFRT